MSFDRDFWMSVIPAAVVLACVGQYFKPLLLKWRREWQIDAMHTKVVRDSDRRRLKREGKL